MNTATKVRDLEDFRGKAALYKLFKRLKYYNYVVVSSTTAYGDGGDETYIFPSNKNGEAIDCGELRGSTRGVYNHETALNNAGYEVK